jgi:hypothetical protein
VNASATKLMSDWCDLMDSMLVTKRPYAMHQPERSSNHRVEYAVKTRAVPISTSTTHLCSWHNSFAQRSASADLRTGRLR